MPQTNHADQSKIDFARDQVKKLLDAHREPTVLGERLLGFAYFGPVADGTGYDEIDVLEVVENWPGPVQGPETVELTGSADFPLPGHLSLTIINPDQLMEAANHAHPILQELAEHSGNGGTVLFDSRGLIAAAIKIVQEWLAEFYKDKTSLAIGRTG